MKHLNFLSTIGKAPLESSSSDIGRRYRVVTDFLPSFCRVNMLKFVSVLVLVLTFGVGNVWGAEETAYTLSGTTTGGTSAYTLQSITQSSVAWKVQGNTIVSPWRIGVSKSGSSGNANFPIYSQTAISENITKIVLTHGTTSHASVNSVTLQVYSTAELAAAGGNGDVSANVTSSDSWSAAGTMTFNRPAGHNWTGRFYRIVYNINCSPKSGSSGYAAYMPFTSAVFKYEEVSCDKKVSITKGTPETGGSFNLDKTGAQDCCDALTVTVSSIVAPSGKKFSAITQSGIASGVTINQSAKTVTYAANTTGSSTINVTYEDKGCTDHGASSITGGALSDADHGPVHAYYDYSTSQFLYTKSDLDLAAGKKGTIKSIYFEYSGATAMAARTIKIYMANTDLSSLTTSNYVPYASFTQVYSGTFSCGSAGWYEIILDTPFDYNGAGQLAVMIDDNTNTYESSKSFKYHSATGKQIYKRQDDTDIDPASWTPVSAIDYRPNTKFCIQEADMVQSTVTWVAGSNPSFGSQTDYEGTALSNPGTPSAASYCPGGKVFVGWTATPIVGEGSAPADLFTSVSGKSIPVGGTTYYAVFATSGSSSKTYQFDITPSQFNTTSYAANNNQKSNTATATDASGATMTVYWTSYQIMKSSSDMQWQKGSGYIYNSTDLGTVNSVTVTKSAGGYSTWYGTTEHPTSGSQGSGKGFFTVKENNTATGKTTQVRVNFTKTITTYSNYATSCCTPLGTINGSVSLAQLTTANPTKLKATWTMNADTGIDSYDLEIYDSNDNKVKTIEGYTSGDEITGLTPCTSYYAKLYTVSQGSPYCDGGLISTSTPVSTIGYTLSVGKSNVTLSSGSEPTNICSNVSATYTAATGYALPTSISVTNAGAENTGWTWSNGTLTINKANVTGNVSTTIAGTCAAPNITVHPASANYVADPNASATALSVTATAAGADLDYQWQSKVGEGNWTNIQGATNSTYTPSRTSAGVTQYQVIVTNHVCSSSRTSDPATITVTAPSVCVAPTFTPSASTPLTGTQSVTLSSETTGATIHYTMTTDGTEPATPTSGSTAYSSAISVTQNTRIKAIAIKDGMQASEVVEAAYLIKCETPTFTPSASTPLTGTQSVTIACETDGAAIYYTTDGTDPDNTKTAYTGAFSVASNQTVKAIAIKSGMENSAIATAAYQIKCETPVISPSAGEYTGAQNVTITCATDGAAIYYTTDGTDPDNTKTAYTGAFSVASNQTVKAIAIKSGMENSAIGSAAYTIKYTVTLNAGGGSVSADGWTASAGVWTKTQAGAFTLPSATPSAACGTDGWTFDGWVTDKVTSETTDKPATVYTTSYTPSADITLYALYKNTVADGPAEYTLVSSAANFTDGTYVVAALSSDRYYFMDGSRVAKGLGVETTGLASSSVVSNKFPTSSLPEYAVEIDVEDDGEPEGDDHYYFMWYTSGNTTKYMDDNTEATTLTWTENTEVNTYHPDFAHNDGTNGCVLLSLSGAKISHNTSISTKESLIRNYASSGSFYNDIYFFKKGNSSSTHYTSNSSCVKYTLSSAVTPDKGTVTLGATQLAEDATTTATAAVTDNTYRFAYWTISGAGASLEHADGEGKSTDNPVTVTMGSANATVTAHFEAIPPHTVTWSVNGVETTKDFLEGTTYATIMADAAKPAVADDAIKTNCGSDKFMGWATSAIADDATYGEVEWYNEATTLADDQTFYAVWATGAEGSKFVRMQELSELESASKIAIVNAYASTHYILKTDLTTASAPAASEGKYTFSDGQFWTLEKSSTNWKFKTGDDYLSVSTIPTSDSKSGAIGKATSGDIEWTIANNSNTENGTPVFYISNVTNATAGLEISQGNWIVYYATNFNAKYYTLELYVPEKVYSAYRTYCCNTPETALSITGANSVAVDKTLSPGTAGGNGGSVVWSIKAGGTGAATINPSTGVLTPSGTGTVTIKAHQDEYNNKCAQDAEMLVEIVAATVNVTGVSLDHTTAALLPGETIQLNATLTPGNATDQTIGWVSSSDAATVNAGLVTAVAKGSSTVTVTTTDGDFTDNCAVTVHGLTIEMKDETGATISAEGVTASADGRDLTASATVASKYVFYQWEMVTASGMSFPVGDEGNADITLSGTPTGDVTIKAIFYKPVSITWLVGGEEAEAGSQTLSVARGTLWSALTPAAEPAGNALGSCATAFVGWSNSMNSELRGNGNPAPAVLFKNAQISSYDTEITKPITFRAVFAQSTAGGTFDGSAGDYKIYALVGETKYYAQGTGSKIESTTDASLATTYTFEAVDGGFAIKTGEYYITYSSSTNLGTSDKAYKWTVGSGVKGTKRLTSETSGRGWIYRAGTTNQFGGYATSNVTAAGTEYYDLEIGSAASYSNYVTVCCTPYTITVNGNDESENKTISTDVEAICDGMTVNLSRSTSCTHYNFNKWVVKYTDGDEEEHTINVTEDANNSGSFTMPAYNVTVEGDWSPRNYTMTVNAPATAKGSVSIVGGSGEGNVRDVAYKSTVTLTITENDPEHYYLRDWTIKNANTEETTTVQGNPLEIEMPGYPIEVTANFADVAYSALTLGSTEGVYSLSATLANGDPIPDATQIKSGTALKVTYALSGQNEFVGWTFSVNSVEKTAEGTTVTFNMPEEALNVSLNTRPYYMLNLSAEHGSITGVSIAGQAQTLAAQYIVHEGEEVTLTAAPENENYKFKEWTGANVNANGQFTVGTSDLDVTAVFELKNTYTLTLMALGREQEKIEDILEGESIWEQIDDKEAPEITGQLFLGWSMVEDAANMIISNDDDLDIDNNYPLYAVYQAMTPCYVKVTSTDDITNGKYLIVYETGGLAFNGGLETLDAASNTIGVEINTVGDYKTIAISPTTTAAEFTIASLDDDGGYSIKSASGKYIGRTGDSNGLNENTETVYTNTLSINNDGNFVCVGGAYMRYNSDSGQERFRYFKSSTYTSQKAIQLYKRAGVPNPAGDVASIPTVTITTPVNADEIYPDGKAGNIVVETGGKVTGSNNVEANDVLIKTTLGTISGTNDNTNGRSGEVSNSHLSATGDVWIQIELTQASEASYGWYAFSVPFRVDAINGVYYGNTKLQNEEDYAIMAFHEDKYAAGEYAWKKYRTIMEPGHLYIISVGDTDYKTLRFKKVADAPIIATSNEVELAKSGDGDNAGWNGVGNPNLQVSHQDAISIMQFLDHEVNSFIARSAAKTDLMVGTAFMIQRPNETSSIKIKIGGNTGDDIIALAPAREPAAIEKTLFEAKLTNTTTGRTEDNLYFTAREDATNTYEAGRDVTKLSMGNAKNAQMTISAYGKQLCAADFPLVNGQAAYPLTITTPAAGNYAISTEASAEADVYLTYEGAIIWNLSESAYPMDLKKGTTEGYGLLLNAKMPQTPTGVDEVTGDGLQVTGAQKVIINNHVYILRNGQMYGVDGKVVK